MKAGGCVLYVMDQVRQVEGNVTLYNAQQDALAKKLPLAVIFCWQPAVGKLDELRQIEADLDKFQIPFMMLIGNTKERVNGVIHHVQPDAVFTDSLSTSASNQQAKLKTHPYSWPGPIIKMAKLEQHIQDALNGRSGIC